MPYYKKTNTPDYDPQNPRCDETQLKFLKECIAEGPDGIEKWNQWHEYQGYKDKDTKVWLQKVNLPGVYLKEVNLHRAHLEGAELQDAYLERANLMQAHIEGIHLYFAHLEGATLFRAHLEGAGLMLAHLEGADLSGAHLEGADLRCAHLENAKLGYTHLEGANLEKADIRKADFSDTFLQGTNCRKAIVDGWTLIWGCKINKRGIKEKNYTDFAGVGLDSARIQPYVKQLLEYNVRKSNWSHWYNQLWNRNLFTKIISSPLVPIKWILVHPFWFISDYGRSTLRILVTFPLIALVYAMIYFYYPRCVYIYGEEAQFVSFLHATYFSIVTMTTLGFGDIAANPKSTLGLLLLMSQVILGYVLLGALVTRFAVLFTAGGPAGRFAEKSQ